jgi:hypothetical protein
MNIERRAGRVNIVDRDSSTFDEEQHQRRLKTCPADGRAMVWVDEVPSYFCPKCGYSSTGAPLPVSFSISDATEPDASEATSEAETPTLSDSTGTPVEVTVQSLSHKVSLGEPTTSDADTEDNNDNLFIMPVSTPRAEEREQELKRKRFPGYDNDLKLLESKGYNLIDSQEYIPNTDDNTTMSSEDMKRQTQRKTKGTW